jgi:hypothetical protein
LLEALLKPGGPVYIVPPEPPQECDVPGNWERAGHKTWQVPERFDPAGSAVERWLFLPGNWRLYRAAHLVESPWPDLFRSEAGEMLAWMETHAIEAVIESFHDDSEWVVAYGPP